MLDELFDLVFPLGFEHDFLDGLHSNHQTVHILNEDVITGNEQFLSASCRRSIISRRVGASRSLLAHRLQVGRRRQNLPSIVVRVIRVTSCRG